MNRRSAAIGLVLGLCIGAPALGQSARPGPDEVPSDLLVSDLKLGPFYVKPSFTLREVGIDSNVFLTESNPEKDFTATLVPGIRLAVPAGEGLVRIDQTISYVFYNRLEEERAWNFDTFFQGSFVLSSLRCDIGERLVRTSERYNVEVVTRTRRTENRFEARLGSDHEAGLYLEGYASHSIIRFPSEETFALTSLADTLDHNELRLGGAGFLEVMDSGRLVLGSEIARNRFRVDSTGRDSDGYFIYSGLRFEGESSISGEMDFGFEKLDFDRAGHPSFSGLAARGDLTFELGDTSRLTLEVARRPQYSVQSDALYYELTRFGARFHVPAGDRFALEAGPTFSRSHYPAIEGQRLIASGRLSTFEVAGLVGITEAVSLRLGLLYRTGRSALTGANYSGSALTSGFDYGR